MSGNERIQPTRRNDRLGTVVTGILFTTLMLVVFPFQSAANAPKELLLIYDAAAKTLTVKITHPSSSPGFHYVAKVEIKNGEKIIATTNYKNQPDQETFSYVYPVEAAPGDLLDVKASCSILGSRTEKLTVSK